MNRAQWFLLVAIVALVVLVVLFAVVITGGK